MTYILSIDQGTTSSRAIVFNLEGQKQGVHQEAFEQHFPRDGWVEHDPKDIWDTVRRCCEGLLKDLNLSGKDIGAIGLTNQRETTLIWNKHTGQPIYNAIVWQDRRTAEYCSSIASSKIKHMISSKTGLVLDSYFSATKIVWLLENVKGAREQSEKGELLFGTVDSFLIWHLTGGKRHVTDITNAARTLLFNIHTQQWDDDLIALFGIPKLLLPSVLDNAADFGKTEKALFGHEIPITGVAGDQQAATIGQACFKEGMVKSTYGTGCFVVMNTGNKVIHSQVSLLSTVAYRLNGKITYALEGSIFNAGTVVQWLRDKIHLIKNASDTEAICRETPSTKNVYLVPAFTGLGAPYWDSQARGAILGLTRDTSDKEIVRAGLESIAYQTKDLVDAMVTDGAIDLSTLRVDGGMVANDWFLQFLANILQIRIQRPECIETTALGVAYLAALGAGFYASLDEIAHHWKLQKEFLPNIPKNQVDALYKGWKKAVKSVLF